MFVDVLSILAFFGAGIAFFQGAGALQSHDDLRAIYMLFVGLMLLRTTAALAKPDRAG
jgi:hypothetical protein